MRETGKAGVFSLFSVSPALRHGRSAPACRVAKRGAGKRDAQAGKSRFRFAVLTLRPSPFTLHASRGFTLVEILVVVLLIGITVSLVTLRLGHDPGKLAEDEARRLAALIEHLRDESTLTGSVYALELDAGGRSYRFLRPTPKWQPVQGDSVLRPRELAEPLRATLELPGAAPGAPAWVYVYPSGEMSPFRFKVRVPGSAPGQVYVVQLESDQTIRVQADRGAG